MPCYKGAAVYEKTAFSIVKETTPFIKPIHNKFEVVIPQFEQGNTNAYTQLHEEFFTPVFFFACRLLGNKEDADDIVAEVFIKLWQLRHSFHSYGNIKSFLFIATRNASFNLLTARSRKLAGKQNFATQHSSSEPPLYKPEQLQEDLIRAELVEYFYYEVQKLPRQMKKILEMRIRNNMRYAAIAANLKTTEGNVRNQLSKGIQRLRKKRGLQKRWILLRNLMHY